MTLNRPKVFNALNKVLIAELKNTFEDSRDDSAVRGVILTGAGDKAFAASQRRQQGAPAWFCKPDPD